MAGLRKRMSYANVVATLSLFIALGGTSYAVAHIGSADVTNNSLRSRDIRNNTLLSRDIRQKTIRAQDVRRDALGSRVIKESSLGTVQHAANADRVGGATAGDLRVTCPTDTTPKAGICIEQSPQTADDFVTAVNRCDQRGRALISMPNLDLFARSNGPLAQPEWTASVYRNPDADLTTAEQLEAVVLHGFGDVSYDRVHAPIQHAFRCVALPSN
jgi:hypothetical protein